MMFEKLFRRSPYANFERLVAFALSLGVMGVIIVSSGHLAVSLFNMAVAGFAEFSYSQFQRIFEQILTILIALEFNHSLTQVASGVHGFIQVRTVLIIAILAVVRKFIVLEVETTSGLFLLGLAASILALGLVYAILAYIDQKEDEHRSKVSSPGQKDGYQPFASN